MAKIEVEDRPGEAGSGPVGRGVGGGWPFTVRQARGAPITRVGEEGCDQHENPVQSPSKKLDA
jgi:hypothetical protein